MSNDHPSVPQLPPITFDNQQHEVNSNHTPDANNSSALDNNSNDANGVNQPADPPIISQAKHNNKKVKWNAKLQTRV